MSKKSYLRHPELVSGSPTDWKIKLFGHPLCFVLSCESRLINLQICKKIAARTSLPTAISSSKHQ